MKMTTNCLSDAQLSVYLRANAAADHDRATSEHLAGCARCRESLERLAGDGHWWSDVESLLADMGDADRAMASMDDDPVGDIHHAGVFAHLSQWMGPTDDPTKLGRVGHYEVIGVIGYGGAGVVLKAHDPRLNRFVAIKVLLPALAHNAAARRRFERESRAVAAVVHQNVVPIYSVDTHNGHPYIAMAYISGTSLQQRLNNNGPLEANEVVRIAWQIAQALAAAHAQGVVHRDIKPANILLESNLDKVLVTDFGLARVVDEAHTHSTVVTGTPQYMSPEQCHGHAADYRSDLFSLGSVMYAMCVGRSPFRSETLIGMLRKVCDATPTRIRELNADIPEWLEVFINRLLAKTPEDRFDSADEVAQLLKQELAHMQNPTVTAMPVRPWYSGGFSGGVVAEGESWLAMYGRRMAISAGIAAAIVAAATTGYLFAPDEGPRGAAGTAGRGNAMTAQLGAAGGGGGWGAAASGGVSEAGRGGMGAAGGAGGAENPSDAAGAADNGGDWGAGDTGVTGDTQGEWDTGNANDARDTVGAGAWDKDTIERSPLEEYGVGESSGTERTEAISSSGVLIAFADESASVNAAATAWDQQASGEGLVFVTEGLKSRTLSQSFPVVEGQALRAANLIGGARLVPGDGEAITIEATIYAAGTDEAHTKRLLESINWIEYDAPDDSKPAVWALSFPVAEQATWRLPIAGHRSMETTQTYLGHVMRLTSDPAVAAPTLLVELVIMVPNDAEFALHNGVGDVRAGEIQGSLALASETGDIRLDGSIGNFSLHSDSGGITAEGSEGTLYANADNGDIVLRGFHGDMHLNADNGDTTIEGATGPVRLNADNGDIRLHGVTGPMNIHSDDGDVTIEGHSGLIDVQSDNGDVNLKRSSGKTTINADGGVIRLDLTELAGSMAFNLDEGEVHITGPTDAAFKITFITESGQAIVRYDDVKRLSAEKAGDEDVSTTLLSRGDDGPDIIIRTDSGNLFVTPAE